MCVSVRLPSCLLCQPILVGLHSIQLGTLLLQMPPPPLLLLRLKLPLLHLLLLFLPLFRPPLLLPAARV